MVKECTTAQLKPYGLQKHTPGTGTYMQASLLPKTYTYSAEHVAYRLRMHCPDWVMLYY